MAQSKCRYQPKAPWNDVAIRHSHPDPPLNATALREGGLAPGAGPGAMLALASGPHIPARPAF